MPVERPRPRGRREPLPAPVDRGGPRAPPPASDNLRRIWTWPSPGADGATAPGRSGSSGARSRTAGRGFQPLTTVGGEGCCRPNPGPEPRRPSPAPWRVRPSAVITADISRPRSAARHDWPPARRRRRLTISTPSASAAARIIGLFAGGGEILRLARPASRSSGFRMRGPSGPAPAAGHDHRLWEDGGVVPPAGRVPRRRRLAGAVAPRTTGSPSARFALDEGLRRLAAAARAGAVAGGSIEDKRAPRREDGNRRAGRGR